MTQNQFILMQVVLLGAAAQLAMGLYLPSLPNMAIAFHVSDAILQQSFSLFTLSYGVSQLFYGVLSDHYGRRPLLLCGMLLLLLGTLWAACATTANSFLIARIIEGLGGGSAAVLARSIISDRFRDQGLAKAMAGLVFAVSITPAISPYLGGLLQHYFGWRSVFTFLNVYLIILLLFVFLKMPETNQHSQTSLARKLQLKPVINNYLALLTNKLFVCYVIIIVFGFSCQLLYLSISPFIFQVKFRINADIYGQLMMVPALAYVLGNYISLRLNQHWHYSKITALGILISLGGGCALTIISLMQLTSISSVLVCITLVIFGYGFISSNAVTGAIAPFKQMAGAASSLLGCIQLAGSSFCIVAVNFFFASTSLVLGISFTVVSLLMLLFACVILREDH